MKIIDLSRPVSGGMPVFPGDVPPVVTVISTVEKDGFAASLITAGNHTGTHMDAPAHLLPGGETLDKLPGEKFFGLAQVVDAARCIGREIETDDIKASVTDISAVDYILINTGWADKWGCEKYLKDYPVLSEQAARWLAAQDLKGVGVDAASVDKAAGAGCDIHKILLERKILIIENLVNLELLPGKPFCFAALPLPLKDADGAPARVMAVLE